MTQLRKKISRFFRLAAHTQLLPILESGDDPLIGGQAVIEGVMMRSPHSYCIAVRRPDGEIVQECRVLAKPSEKYRVFRWPLLRGLGTLGQAMTLGIKALQFSAAHAVEEEDKEEGSGKDDSERKPVSSDLPAWLMWLNVAFSVGFFIFLYKLVPLFAVTQIREHTSWLQGHFGFTFADGLIRMAIFLTFLFAVSRMSDIRRVFEYHGAEHKVVFNYESGEPVTIAGAQSYTTFHPRCGTSFLMVVMLISIVVYSLVPVEGFGPQFLARIVLLPVIAGVSYEVIRFAARNQGGLWAAMATPGLWLQRITTKQPADDQVEVSIQALEGTMELEREQSGELVVA